MMKFSKEIRIALVAIAGIAVLYFGLQFLKGMTLFSSDNRYFVKFQDVSGLSVASPIFANGYRVGVVEEIVFNYNNTGEIIATIGVNQELNVPKGSRAEISTDLMGNVKVLLTLGNVADGVVAPGDTIYGGQQVGAMGKAADMIPTIQQMLPKLDSILASVNTLLADPAIASSLHNVDQITRWFLHKIRPATVTLPPASAFQENMFYSVSSSCETRKRCSRNRYERQILRKGYGLSQD